jgi:16S rRNA (guanine966-N2)-methyltransferase
MRLVAGRFKGRVLAAPEGMTTRPTGDRVREALFNILAHGEPPLEGAQVVDVFAGSGALGLEALSRGAAHVTFFESDPKALAVIAANIRKLGCEDCTTLMRCDAANPPKAVQPCQYLLLDPPYRSGLAAPALVGLRAQGWIARDARIVVEVAAAEGFKSPLPDFPVADDRKYGAARLVFLAPAEQTLDVGEL